MSSSLHMGLLAQHTSSKPEKTQISQFAAGQGQNLARLGLLGQKDLQSAHKILVDLTSQRGITQPINHPKAVDQNAGDSPFYF